MALLTESQFSIWSLTVYPNEVLKKMARVKKAGQPADMLDMAVPTSDAQAAAHAMANAGLTDFDVNRSYSNDRVTYFVFLTDDELQAAEEILRHKFMKSIQQGLPIWNEWNEEASMPDPSEVRTQPIAPKESASAAPWKVSGQFIPLAQAYICGNCEAIGDSSKQCPACQSTALESIANQLGGSALAKEPIKEAAGGAIPDSDKEILLEHLSGKDPEAIITEVVNYFGPGAAANWALSLAEGMKEGSFFKESDPDREHSEGGHGATGYGSGYKKNDGRDPRYDDSSETSNHMASVLFKKAVGDQITNCPNCEQPIKQGEMVNWTSSGSEAHVHCPAGAGGGGSRILMPKNYQPNQNNQNNGQNPMPHTIAPELPGRGQYASAHKKYEAYGVKGMSNSPWRKEFNSYEEAEMWAERNNAEIKGWRDTEEAARGNLTATLSKDASAAVAKGRKVRLASGARVERSMEKIAFDVKTAKVGISQLHDEQGFNVIVNLNGTEYVLRGADAEQFQQEYAAIPKPEDKVNSLVQRYLGKLQRYSQKPKADPKVQDKAIQENKGRDLADADNYWAGKGAPAMQQDSENYYEGKGAPAAGQAYRRYQSSLVSPLLQRKADWSIERNPKGSAESMNRDRVNDALADHKATRCDMPPTPKQASADGKQECCGAFAPKHKEDCKKYNDNFKSTMEKLNSTPKKGSKTAGGAPIKLTVNLHGKPILYTKHDLEEMLAEPKRFEQADNLPVWVQRSLLGTDAVPKIPRERGREYSNKAFDRAYALALQKIQGWANSPTPVNITIDERFPHDSRGQSMGGDHSWTLSLKEGSAKKVAYVSHVPGHRNSKGESAPWVIKQHNTDKILESFTSEGAANDGLKNMESHKGSAAAQQVEWNGKKWEVEHPDSKTIRLISWKPLGNEGQDVNGRFIDDIVEMPVSYFENPRGFFYHNASARKLAFDPALATFVAAWVAMIAGRWMGRDKAAPLAKNLTGKAEQVLQKAGISDFATLDRYAQDSGMDRYKALGKLALQQLALSAALTLGVSATQLLSKTPAPAAAPQQTSQSAPAAKPDQMTITDEVDAPAPGPTKEEIKQQEKQQFQQRMQELKEQDKNEESRQQNMASLKKAAPRCDCEDAACPYHKSGACPSPAAGQFMFYGMNEWLCDNCLGHARAEGHDKPKAMGMNAALFQEPVEKSCWGCGGDWRNRWSADDLAPVKMEGEARLICPDCIEEVGPETLEFTATDKTADEYDDHVKRVDPSYDKPASYAPTPEDFKKWKRAIESTYQAIGADANLEGEKPWVIVQVCLDANHCEAYGGLPKEEYAKFAAWYRDLFAKKGYETGLKYIAKFLQITG